MKNYKAYYSGEAGNELVTQEFLEETDDEARDRITHFALINNYNVIKLITKEEIKLWKN
jgi:hypothetical protein